MGQRITKPGAPGGSKVQMAALEEDAAAAGVVDPGAVELDMSNGDATLMARHSHHVADARRHLTSPLLGDGCRRD